MSRIKFFLPILLVLIPQKAYAFLPPEYFVQGLTSVWVILTGGVVMVLVPFLTFYKTIKGFVGKHKKLIIYLLIQNVIVAIIAGLVFFYGYYKPLYEKSYLFSEEMRK